MAELFKARFEPAPGVTKQVVIKKILPHYAANRTFIRMFKNEAAIAMGLSHGNIAQVFDFGEIDGDWFLAMELVDGQSLAKVARRLRDQDLPCVPPPYAAFVTLEALKGLHYAHTRLDEKGRPLHIVHRDVSPQNILLSYEGQVKLVDFGIARARNASGEKTEAGAVKGKYAYFAPEQARAKELDARTDVFAAGVVLYELLTGQLPFPGRMMEALTRLTKGEFVPPSQANPDVPATLERIVLKAMALRPEDRYQSADEFQQALSTWLFGHVPNFGAGNVAQLMALLFEKELVEEGRPARVAPDLVAQLAMYRRPGASAADPAEAVVTAPGHRKGQQRSRERSRPAPRRSGARAWWVALPVGAMVLAAAGVVLAFRTGTFGLQVTSLPPGAEVLVDGTAARQPTPLVLEGLRAAVPHVVEVRAPGHRDWRQTVQAQRGGRVALHAELEAVAPAPDTRPQVVAAEGPPDAASDPAAPSLADAVPMEAWYPQATFEVRADRHVFPVPGGVAAKVALDPKKSYRLWTEGTLSFGGYVDSIFLDQCVYFLEGPAVPAHEAFGVLGPRPLLVRGATAVHLFETDIKPHDNSGALKVRVQQKGGALRTVLVDAKVHNLVPATDQRFTYQGLEQLGAYRLEVREAKRPARTRPTGRPARVLFGQMSGFSVLEGKKLANEAQRVLEAGHSYEIRGTQWFWLSFPDGPAADHSSVLELELTAIAGTGGFQLK